MKFDPVTMDLLSEDPAHPSVLIPMTFDSHGSELLSKFLLASGPGPHPVVVLLHGFPGNEPNFDLAHAICRAGWNVLTFHYRGSWGSPGDFSFKNALADGLAAVDFVSSERARSEFRCDPARIVLIGHSMGGFIALHTAAVDRRVRGVATIGAFNFGAFGNWLIESQSRTDQAIENFRANVRPIRGTTSGALIRETIGHRKEWDLDGLGDRVRNVQLLIQYGTRDTISVPEIHHHALMRALGEGRQASLQERRYECDHMFTQVRIALARETIQWMRSF